MSNYVKIAAETGDRYLAALEAGQENFLKFVTAFSQITPPPPAIVGDYSALRAYSEAGFALTQQFLEQQQAICEKYFADRASAAASRPAGKAAGKPVSKPRRKPARKPAIRAASTTPSKPVAVQSSKNKVSAKPSAAPADGS